MCRVPRRPSSSPFVSTPLPLPRPEAEAGYFLFLMISLICKTNEVVKFMRVKDKDGKTSRFR